PRFTDLDDDGHPDLALVADFGTSRLYWNDGDGTFTDGTHDASVGTDENGMGSAIADFDGDGLLDWFITSIYDPEDTCGAGGCNWGTTGNRMFRNLGDRTFDDVTDEAGVRDGGWGWGASGLDYDNDGDMDLAMTNGINFETDRDDPFETDRSRLWRNDGGGSFTEVGEDLGVTDVRPGKGLLTFDYDGDGDLDLFIVNHGDAPVLYRNDGGNENDWLQVRVVGVQSNRDGIGARVTVTPDLDAPEQVLVREIDGGSHYLAQSDLVAHFGLGPSAGTVDRVRAELHMLLCARDVRLGVLAVKSLLRFTGDEVAVTFTDDGSLTSRHCDLVDRHVTGARWLARCPDDPRIDAACAARPLLGALYRDRRFPFGLKLLHPLLLGDASCVISLDADTAFFERPETLIEYCRGAIDGPVYLHDHQDEAVMTPVAQEAFGSLESALGREGRPWRLGHRFFNAGLLAYRPQDLDLDHAERYLAWREAAPPRFTNLQPPEPFSSAAVLCRHLSAATPYWERVVYSWMVRRLAMPSISLLTRSRWVDRYRDMLSLERSGNGAVDSVRCERLQRLIRHAYEHVPYYGKLMHEAGVTPSDFERTDDVARLPALTKQKIERHFPDRITSDVGDRGDWRYVSTRGTTNRLMVVQDFEKRDLVRAATLRALQLSGGYRAGHKSVEIPPDVCSVVCGDEGETTGAGRQVLRMMKPAWWRDPQTATSFRGMIERDLIYRRKTLAPFGSEGSTLTDERLEQYVRELRRYRPRLIKALPTYLLELARYVVRHGEAPLPIDVVKPMGGSVSPVMR
ncbi:MAG: hypothetical protein CMJ18_28250, partial [Phycisphaeraceae bacterium]|nr:hypothetical protein [Phycisphaeraceae bacterium]